jgi:hypothetical protein
MCWSCVPCPRYLSVDAIAIGHKPAAVLAIPKFRRAKAAHRVVAAIGADWPVAPRRARAGRHRERLDRAAQIVGRLRAERAGTLRDADAADVFGTDDAADVQAVVVAIAHVAQRDAVEVEAKLVLVEAADGDPGRPFIVAERVGGLDVDAGQLFNRLERLVPGVSTTDFLRCLICCTWRVSPRPKTTIVASSGAASAAGAAVWAKAGVAASMVEASSRAVAGRMNFPLQEP